MHTGATTAEPYTYHSFFSYARPTQLSESFSSVGIKIHSGNGHRQDDSALSLGHDMGSVPGNDDEDDDQVPSQAMSASGFADPVSSSPAAMFLSAFISPKPSAAQPDSEGDVISTYTLGPIIGHGAFSTIRRAYSTSGDAVAVKIIRRSDHFKRGNATLAKKQIKHEAQIWGTLSHEHVLPLFQAAHTPYADYFFTLYCPAGSLYDILKRDGRPELPHDDAGMMFRQVVRGLRYLHEVAMFVHRDMKLENVLVDESGVCRIGDFGMTKRIGEPDEDEEDEQESQQTEVFQAGQATVHRATSLFVPGQKAGSKALSLQVQMARHRNSTSTVHTPPPTVRFPPGSLPYAAPELLLPQSGPIAPHPAQDIWALGVLLFALLTGRLPFSDSFEPRLLTKILNGVYELPPGVGRGAERVIKGCLNRSDASRWNIAMVDEVAWGVGWGSENDDVTPADSDEEEFQMASHSRSRSRHRVEETIPEDTDIEWRQEEPTSKPSNIAASRRSSSRMQRSLSRAPHSRPPLSRSRSTHSPAPSPSTASFNASSARSPSLSRSPSNVHSPSSARPPHFYDPLDAHDVHISFSFERERGRRRQKVSQSSHSQSPSPSIAAPTTPSDSLGPEPDFHRSASRGRRRKVEFDTPLPLDNTEHEHMYVDEGLETLDETQHTPAFSPRRRHEPTVDGFAGRRMPRSQSKPSYDPRDAYGSSRYTSKRNGSTPPNSGEAWPRPRPLSGGSRMSAANFPTSLLKPVQPTTAVDRRTRSRSLDFVR